MLSVQRTEPLQKCIEKKRLMFNVAKTTARKRRIKDPKQHIELKVMCEKCVN